MRLFVSALLTASLVTLSGPAFLPAQDARHTGEKSEVATDEELREKPLYQMTENEVARYIAIAQEDYPDLRDRVVHLARKNLGQPYEIFLLGEAPFELYDPQPMYCIEKSDCVVYAEHTYAYALSDDWPSFFAMLQRIRYNDGQIGATTRNHYTEADWTVNNDWLVTDISRELAGDKTKTYTLPVNRAKMFRDRYGIETDIPSERIDIEYIAAEDVMDVVDGLEEGDLVNFVRGRNGGYWVGHVGLIGKTPEGEVTLIHSTPPQVKEEPIDEYLENAIAANEKKREEGKAEFAGFRFLRLADDPIANLKAIDGDAAPKVQLPGGALLAGR